MSVRADWFQVVDEELLPVEFRGMSQLAKM